MGHVKDILNLRSFVISPIQHFVKTIIFCHFYEYFWDNTTNIYLNKKNCFIEKFHLKSCYCQSPPFLRLPYGRGRTEQGGSQEVHYMAFTVSVCLTDDTTFLGSTVQHSWSTDIVQQSWMEPSYLSDCCRLGGRLFLTKFHFIRQSCYTSQMNSPDRKPCY